MEDRARKRRKKSMTFRVLKKVVDVGIFIFAVLILTYLVSTFVAQRIVVHNVSMKNTLSEGDILLMDKVTYRVREPKRYEIICFDSDYEREGLIKRVIGLPGETIMISDGMIFINGNQIKDAKGVEKVEDAGLASQEIHLDQDEYFVLGDNRPESMDSRYPQIGNVKKKDIVGRAILRIGPFSKFGWIK